MSKTVDRMFGGDSHDLRWFFRDSDAQVSGIRAIPIEPASPGRDEDGEDRAEVRRNLAIRRQRRMLETIALLPDHDACVLCLVFRRPSDYPSLPSMAWLDSSFGEYAALAMTSDMLGLVAAARAKNDRLKALELLSGPKADRKVRDEVLKECVSAVESTAALWRDAKRVITRRSRLAA